MLSAQLISSGQPGLGLSFDCSEVNVLVTDGGRQQRLETGGVFLDTLNLLVDDPDLILDKIYYPKLEKFIRFKLIDIIFNHIDVNYEKEDISNHIVKALKVPNSVTSFTSLFVYWIVTFLLTTILIIRVS